MNLGIRKIFDPAACLAGFALPTPAVVRPTAVTAAITPAARTSFVLRIDAPWLLLLGWCGDGDLRRFSLDLLLSRAPRPRPRQAASLDGAHDVSGENRSEEQRAYDDVLGCAADVGELHPVAKNRDQDQCEEDAEHGAGAAEDVDAAEH